MLATALCSALLASGVRAQVAPTAAPVAVPPAGAIAPEPAPDPKFPKCVGPDDSHRLTEIVRSDAFTQANDPPGAAADFLKIMEKADARVQRSLKEFQPVFREGFTLVVPQNVVPTPQGPRPLFQFFGINPDSISEVNATAIVRAHLILGTVTAEGVRAQLQTAQSVRFLSLDRDYSWTFTNGGPGGGLALVDPRAAPVEGDGLLDAEVGVTAATPPGRCPNALIVVSGFMVVPEDLTPEGREAARAAAEERSAVLAQPPPPPSESGPPPAAATAPPPAGAQVPAAAPPPLGDGGAQSGTNAPTQAEAGTSGAAAACGVVAAALAAVAASAALV